MACPNSILPDIQTLLKEFPIDESIQSNGRRGTDGRNRIGKVYPQIGWTTLRKRGIKISEELYGVAGLTYKIHSFDSDPIEIDFKDSDYVESIGIDCLLDASPFHNPQILNARLKKIKIINYFV